MTWCEQFITKLLHECRVDTNTRHDSVIVTSATGIIIMMMIILVMMVIVNPIGVCNNPETGHGTMSANVPMMRGSVGCGPGSLCGSRSQLCS